MPSDAILSWLLEPDNPPVRLMALTHLLSREPADPEVQATRSALMDYSVTRGILDHIDEIWASTPRQALSFRGKLWSTVFLGHFRADRSDPRLKKELRGLADVDWPKTIFPCMAACMLRALGRLGFANHGPVVQGIETLAAGIVSGPGVACRCTAPSLLSHCYMSLPKLLLCLAETPAESRSATVQEAIAWITEELISHQVYVYVPGNQKAWHAVRPKSRKKADAPAGETPASWVAKEKAQFLKEHGPGEPQPKTGWTKFGFPLNYNSDILEAMLALALADVPMDARLEEPLRILADKETADGKWVMEKSLNGQMWADVETKGEPSKWLTLFASLVLDHFG